MSSKRLFFILTGVFALLIIGMGCGAYEINSILGVQSTKLVSLKAKSQALTEEQMTLVKAKKEIAKYSSLNQITQAIVPQDKDQAEAVREIVNIAQANGVYLGSITFPASTLGGSALHPVAAATTSGSATATVNPNSSTVKLSQLQAVKNIPGVYELPITVSSDPNNPVPYERLVSFMAGLEHNRRTSQISTISLTPDTKNPDNLNFNIVIVDYIKP